MDKSKIYLDLSKCSEAEQKHIISMLPESQYEGGYEVHTMYKYLHYNESYWFVDAGVAIYNKQELTYPEFIKLFAGGENIVFNIDFGGHVMAGLKIVNGEIEVVGAMNGYGNGISADKIIIIKSNQ